MRPSTWDDANRNALLLQQERAFVPDAPQETVDAANETFFVADIPRLAEKLDAFVYHFDWQVPGKTFKACHRIDLPFLLGTHDVWAAFLHGKRPSPAWDGIRPMRP